MIKLAHKTICIILLMIGTCSYGQAVKKIKIWAVPFYVFPFNPINKAEVSGCFFSEIRYSKGCNHFDVRDSICHYLYKLEPINEKLNDRDFRAIVYIYRNNTKQKIYIFPTHIKIGKKYFKQDINFVRLIYLYCPQSFF